VPRIPLSNKWRGISFSDAARDDFGIP